ncbi:hypothetical protein BDV33DRAFT_185844, partial [Aspergillus novoparasiticus]
RFRVYFCPDSIHPSRHHRPDRLINLPHRCAITGLITIHMLGQLLTILISFISTWICRLTNAPPGNYHATSPNSSWHSSFIALGDHSCSS